ncbi:MAG: arylsulfatase [SAR202 cluster bacterium]|nr:arylsulfatase [SAR202 cluster bacterium]
MGYSDLGCYGSEINTPNIDSLASNGIRFSQMYNSARCCPSRAALLTGLNPQQTGVGHMVSTFGQSASINIPAYQGYLNETSATIAEVLKENGYQTYMSGKWHVGGGYDLTDASTWTPGNHTHPTPVQRGFDKFFGIVAGAANFFHPRTLMKDEKFLDIDTSDFYLTDAISENAVSMLEDSSKTEKPFFMHVAYTAPHWPLQAYEEDIAKYLGKYRQGWDKIRTSRHEELKGMGILDSKWEISPRDSSSRPWGTVDGQVWEDLRMAVYAAMIDRMDQGIGKILDKLRELSLDENTVVMFLSDNGGCAEFLAEETERPTPLQYSTPTPDGRKIQIGNRKDLNPGSDDTFMSYDLPWANASNTPFRLFKRWTHEGGISTPFILSWPKRINKSSIVHEPTHIIDIAATIYDAAQAVYPKEYNGNPITALEGSSFLEVLNEGNWERTDSIYWEHEGSRAMRDGEWKLVSEVGEGWELYNMSEDRTELNNLAEKEKDRLLKMQNSYKEWMNRCGVEDWPIPPQTWNPIMHAPHTHSSPSPR